MSKIENASSANQAARLLNDRELECVAGGIIDGCIRLPSIIPHLPPEPEGFRDVFAKYTIGRYLPV